MNWRRVVPTAAALVAMVLVAVTPRTGMVMCFAADGTVSLEMAHASGSCAHKAGGDHGHDEVAHDHGSDELLDHDHGCTDRPLDDRFVIAGAAVAAAAPVQAACLVTSTLALPTGATLVNDDGARGPPAHPYHRRTVVMLI